MSDGRGWIITEAMDLYPLKFKPRYVEKIWGGRKLETVLGKTLPTAKPVGESWEVEQQVCRRI